MPSENLPTEDRLPPGSDGYSVSDVLPELARAHAEQRAADVEQVEDLVVSLPLPSLEDVDRYPRWHSSYCRESIVRALLLKHVLGLSSDAALRRQLRSDPYLLGRLGFDTVPNQSTFWRARNRRFDAELLAALRDAARELAAVAQDHGLDAPGPVERDDRAGDAGRDGRLADPSPVVERAQDAVDHAQEFAFPHFSLDRADNSCVPESAFWALQSFAAIRDGMHVNAGAKAFRAQSRRDVTPGGENHRDQLRAQSPEEYRRMFQHAVEELVGEAKARSAFEREVDVAIDITTSGRFYGERDGIETDVYGTKGGDYAYQWAAIQIVSGGPPLVLDARPVRKGETRGEVVADLLDAATDHVALGTVMLDREFDSAEVKTACEQYGARYLNPKRKYASEKATEERLARAEKTVHVEEQQTVVTGETRKQVFVPSRRASEGAEPEQIDEERQEHRQQLWTEMADQLGLDLGDGDERMFADVGNWFSQDHETDDSAGSYAVFETNVGMDVSATGRSLVHEVSSVVRRYRRRWTIENAFKSIKRFMVPTTSRSPTLRFFNFLFATLLYDVWRLVDLLVREEFGVEADAPVVPFSRVVAFARRATGIG